METSGNLIGKSIAKEQLKGKVAKWCKTTTTLPSGRHLGHCKGLICQFAESPDTYERREMFRKREDIINAHVSLLNYVAEQ
eukprot:5451962-Ditylum_brightwellii.AAC.1